MEVTQLGHLKGKVLGVIAMNTNACRDIVSDGPSRGYTVLGLLSLVTSVPIASTPIPYLCAYSLVLQL